MVFKFIFMKHLSVKTTFSIKKKRFLKTGSTMSFTALHEAKSLMNPRRDRDSYDLCFLVASFISAFLF